MSDGSPAADATACVNVSDGSRADATACASVSMSDGSRADAPANPGPDSPRHAGTAANDAAEAAASTADLLKLLRAGQMLLVKYPVAARAVARAFVAEGKRYAETEEGRALKERLAGSPVLRRGRLVWEGCSLNMLEEDGDVLLPSVLLEAVMAAAASDRLESLLSTLFTEGGRDADARGP